LRKTQIAIAVAILLSLFAAWTMLAYSGALDSVFRQKNKKGGTVSTASFNSNSPSKEYIYAGGRLVATEEPTSLPAPTNFKAIADTVGQIVLSWDAVQVATKYEVQRGATLNGTFSPITPPNQATSPYTDSSVPFNYNSSTITTYLYKVRASDGSNWSPFSNLDLATAIIWTDDQIQPQSTVVRAQHLLEMRDAVNAVRLAAEKSTITNWQSGLAVQQQIKAVHVTELRTNLDEALNAINPPPQPAYTDPNLTGGRTTNVKKAHVEDLRRRVRHRSGT
jgi:hypothetical protein